MNKKTTKAIVLKRVDFGDSDRIITILTPDLGKISLMAKGVRKITSKMAGSIELFSVLDAGFVSGRGQVGRLTSARLDEHYGQIVKDIKRVQLGYEILRHFDRNIEDNAESAYFYLLCQLLRLLNEESVELTKVDIYFKSRLLSLAGHSPNLTTDQDKQRLFEAGRYSFNMPSMCFYESDSGVLGASHIKLMRLLFSSSDAQKVFNLKVAGSEDEDVKPLIDTMFKTYLSV